MRYAVYAILIFIAMILQTTVVPFLSILDIKPDLLCALLIPLALIQGPLTGAALGGICGLILDMMFMSGGFYCPVYTVLCAMAGMLGKRVKPDRFVIPALAGFIAYVLKDLVTLSYLFFGRVDILFSAALVKLLLGSVYTLILLLPIYWGLTALERLPFMRSDYGRGGGIRDD